MKYQKNIPATKPNKVQIPDQKTLTANAKVIIINEEGRKAEQSALPLHGMQDYLPAPRLMSLIATRMPATPTTTAMAIGATVVRIPSKDDSVTVDGHQAGALEVVCAKGSNGEYARNCKNLFHFITSLEMFFIYRPAARFIRWITTLMPPDASMTRVAILKPDQKPLSATICNSCDSVSGKSRKPLDDETSSAYPKLANTSAVIASLHTMLLNSYTSLRSSTGFHFAISVTTGRKTARPLFTIWRSSKLTSAMAGNNLSQSSLFGTTSSGSLISVASLNMSW